MLTSVFFQNGGSFQVFDGLTLLLCRDDLSKSCARTQFPGTQPYEKNNKAEIVRVEIWRTFHHTNLVNL